MDKNLISVLIDAVIIDDEKQVKNLLLRGVDPNGYEDSAKITPLHYAALNNSINSARLLIEAGSNIFAKTDLEEYTPFGLARLYENKIFIYMLNDYGLKR